MIGLTIQLEKWKSVEVDCINDLMCGSVEKNEKNFKIIKVKNYLKLLKNYSWR